MYRRSLLLLICTVLIACGAPRQVDFPRDTTLIILRHADREGEDLTTTGIARANALVKALEGVDINAIYSPGIKRNIETAAPLARDRGITIQRIPAENPAAQLMASGAGKTIVWVGNKGNLNAIWDAIGAPGLPPLTYGDLFFVTRARLGSLSVERRRVEP